ncbi:type III PLP-dependent enzyme [Roseovarius faecimaris]|uniref:ornithine decarboxylase n=1 Tax=Roseovarius faecimaris TaxID=2494550 RepID=A0A6I6IQD3_9RHOB|nr:type III PLP-dependent enzyme [Roseovarius faecimaris]QGX97687.1 type III PLP-dependent enzyme [Roseovarius faecimaris]
MRASQDWQSPVDHLSRERPDTVQLYFSPSVLQATAARFRAGFPGLVTYAVKANPSAEVLANLSAAGITAFDVASPEEMRAVRAVNRRAVLHYNNPVRSAAEVEVAIASGVASYSVDDAGELAKLSAVPKGTEISVRLALPVKGAAYDFGSKFGTTPARAAALLREVKAMGLTASLTFHPGTQCADPAAWAAYIRAAVEVSEAAGVPLARLNVGGGFAAHRWQAAPDLEAIFARIHKEVRSAFGTERPALVCEPGRAMVAEAFTLATRVKALRADGSIFLNDGIYGGLAEARDMPVVDRVTALSPAGEPRLAPARARVIFGPTCDSIDRLPDPLALPADLAEGDYVLFRGMGAYAQALNTGFNGYGLCTPVTVTAA